MNTSDFTENRFLKLIDNLDQRGTSQSDGVPFSPFRPFEDLSMKERAAVIRIGVQNGLRDLESIRSKYNEFAEGGKEETIEKALPEVVVKPSEEDKNSLAKMIRMLPDAKSREDIYYEIDPFRHLADEPIKISQNESIDRLYDVYKQSGYPKVSNHRTVFDYLTYPFSKDLNRSSYNPITNTMHLPNSEEAKYDAEGFIPELAHAYQFNGNNADFWGNFFHIPGDIKIGGKSGYERPGHMEHTAHSVIEPAIYDYVQGYTDSFNPQVYANGGKIHIKPENRGKFTALKERTGHSASWFKAHGTPAQKKMATFALNARKWKHGDGGRLFAEGGEEDNEEYYPIWLDGVTVKPSGNRSTTRDDWNWANWRELQNEREQQAAESVRRGIDRNGTPIAAGIYGLAAAPFAIEGLGSSAVANGIRTGLQAMNTTYTPSTWLNPVTGAKLLSPTVGTIADAGIQGAFAYEGLNGLYNQGREGTLLSDPASTFMHGLEVLPLVGLGSKAIGSAYKNFANSNIVKNRGFALPINNTIYWVGKGLGSEISLAPGTEGYMRVSDVLSKSPGTGRKLYDAAIKYAQNNGYRGIESGNMLLSAPKTYRIWEHYPNRQLLGNYGTHNNFNMASYGELDNVGSIEDMVANTAKGIPTKFEGAPVYGLTESSVETAARAKQAYGTPKADIMSIEGNDITIGSPQTSTDEFIELLKSRTGKNVTRKPISEVPSRSDIYTHGYSYVDDEGNEIAHIFGNKQRGNVYVEDSFVSPDYRSSGIGKKMYFDFNKKVYDELGRPLRSSPFQHQFTMKDPETGRLISPSSRLWKGLKDKGMARTIGSGFNWEYVMEPPSVIQRRLNPTRIILEEPAAMLRRNQSMIMNYYNNAQSSTFNNALNYVNNLNNTEFYSKLNDTGINDYILNTKFTKKYGGPLVEYAMGGRLKHKNKKNKSN